MQTFALTVDGLHHSGDTKYRRYVAAQMLFVAEQMGIRTQSRHL